MLQQYRTECHIDATLLTFNTMHARTSLHIAVPLLPYTAASILSPHLLAATLYNFEI
ncbi:hypothetical protein K440DRAFT_621488, partial [Wilcoxina mikolae CBS 423.85]